MKGKIFIWVVIVLGFSLVNIPFLNAQEKQVSATQKEQTSDSFEIPDWLKRTDYGVIIENDQAPRLYIETVQPLRQSVDKINTFFTHDRISIQNGRGTYSAGFGYRRLMLDETVLAGVNTFFDYQELRKHYRTGVGLEAITDKFEARANSYFGLSPKRIIEENAATSNYEKAVDGFDVELGCPFPYVPWVKLFGGYYWYDFKKANKNLTGWKARGEVKPFKFITFNVETNDDNKSKREYRVDGRFNLKVDDFTPKSICSAFKVAKEPFPKVDLRERTLDRVERNFNIMVEKWVESGSMSVEIGRK